MERTWLMLFMILEDLVLITLCPVAEVSEFSFVIPHQNVMGKFSYNIMNHSTTGSYKLKLYSYLF